MPHAHPTLHKRRRGGWILLTLLATLPMVAFWLYREATAVPDFYAEALQAVPAERPVEVAAEDLEREVLSLQNNVQRAEPWRVVLREEDINAWLATELREKLPHLVPKEMRDPRVVVRDNTVYFACRVEGVLSGVFSVALEPSLTERPNEVAIRVQSVSLGRIPLPQKQYLDHVSAAAARANLPVRWEEEDGTAVAMLLVPARQEKYRDRYLQVETLEIANGEVIIAGRAERLTNVSTQR
jgi:uncharacterized protein YpmS